MPSLEKSDNLIEMQSTEVIKPDTSSPTETNSKKFTSRQWMTIVMLAFANLFSTINYSCIFPFFPGEAQKKGLSKTESGIIIGIFEFVMLIAFPLFGKYMHLLGPRKAFSFGLFFAGISTISFAFVNLFHDDRMFFWISFGVRCALALADTAFVTSSFVISTKCFPGRMNTVIGIMETSIGSGISSGSIIGGVLYEYGGFRLPFLVIGTLLILATILSFFLIEKFDENTDESEDGKGIFGMLKIPIIWVMIFAIIVCGISSTFLGPTLADHLVDFKLSAALIGLMFFVRQSMFAISAPIFGITIDRWQCSNTIMISGAITTIISLLLIGPSPLLNLEKNLILIGISLALLGIGAEAVYLPTYKYCLDVVKKHGYEDTLKTYGYVTGITESALACGCFIGPTLGAFSVQRIGFGWTTTVIAFINVIFIFTIVTSLVTKSKVHPEPSNTSGSKEE